MFGPGARHAHSLCKLSSSPAGFMPTPIVQTTCDAKHDEKAGVRERQTRGHKIRLRMFARGHACPTSTARARK
eukprot:11220762-Lingulodinium_polyedra.AAC.1